VIQLRGQFIADIIKGCLLLGLTVTVLIVCTAEQKTLSVGEAIEAASSEGRNVKVSGYYLAEVETLSLASGRLSRGDSVRLIYLYRPGPHLAPKTPDEIAKILSRKKEILAAKYRLQDKFVTVTGKLVRGKAPGYPFGNDTIFILYDQIAEDI